MYKFKKIMVALDFTAMDETLINYAAYISYLVSAERIYFINVQKSLEIPEHIRSEFPELEQPKDEQLRDDMEKQVKTIFKGYEDFEIDYVVGEGHEIKEMLHWAEIKNIDLLLVGRKSALKGSGHTAQQLARKIKCSVLMVPEKAQFVIKEMLVPADFSEYSKMTVETALELTGNAVVKMFIQNIYELPSGYYTTGRTEDEFADIMRSNAVKEYEAFIKSMNLENRNVEAIFELDHHHSPAKIINRTAHEKKVDLILIGARGRTLGTSIFLGSVTEKLVKMDSDIPLLIVKSKEKSFDFLQLLKTI